MSKVFAACQVLCKDHISRLFASPDKRIPNREQMNHEYINSSHPTIVLRQSALAAMLHSETHLVINHAKAHKSCPSFKINRDHLLIVNYISLAM
jgi:hypothetical protein